MERFRSSVDGPTSVDSAGNTTFRMKWKVCPGIHSQNYEVCRKVFLYCYQITEHHIKEISKTLKATEHGFVAATTARPFNEKHNIGIIFIYDLI